jgi:hypothetical protein
MSYGGALEKFCDEYAISNPDCSSASVDSPCFTWFTGLASEGSNGDALDTLLSQKCDEPSDNSQDISWYTDECEGALSTLVQKCTANAFVEIKFEGALQMDAELPDDEEAAAIFIEVLERTVAASIGGGAFVTILSVNGVLVGTQSSRRLESEGVVFEAGVSVPCQDSSCSNAETAASEVILAASESILEATSSDCETNCFSDQMQVASLVVANEVAAAKGISVSEVINSPSMTAAAATLSSAQVSGAIVDTEQRAAISDVQEGSLVEAIVDEEEANVITTSSPTASPTVSETVEETDSGDSDDSDDSDDPYGGGGTTIINAPASKTKVLFPLVSACIVGCLAGLL